MNYITLSGKELNENFSKLFEKVYNEKLQNERLFMFFKNGDIDNLQGENIITEILNNDDFNEIIKNEIEVICKKSFEIIGSCVTEKALKQFKSGQFWSKNFERFINDESIIFTEIEMTEIYINELLENDNLEDYTNNLQKLFNDLFDDDEVYIPIEYLKNIDL